MASETGVHCRQSRAVPLMNADDEFLGDEAMHLRHALAIACHAEGDDVDELVVVVDSGPLAELVGRLDGHRVEVERLDQHACDVVVRPRIVDVQVQPEEGASGECLFDPLLSGVAQASILSQRSLHRDDSPSRIGFRRWMLPDRARPTPPQPSPPLPPYRPRPLRPELHRAGAPHRPTCH